MTPETLAVIIPMYNEEKGAERCVRSVTSALIELGSGFGFFVVNDGSRDRTLDILERLRREGFNFEIVNQVPNQGYGQALLSGAEIARQKGYSFGLFMDSDLTNDPKYIKDFYETLRSGRYDMVKASRYIQGGGMDGVPPYRQRVSRWGNRVASCLFRLNIKDCTNGFRAVRLSLLENMHFEERGFPSIVEELYYFKKEGARVTDIPNVLTTRADDINASKFSYQPSTFWRYLKYALKASMVRSKRA